jgi:hypothetical protein
MTPNIEVLAAERDTGSVRCCLKTDGVDGPSNGIDVPG